MRVLVIRLGAFGDCLIITPVLRELKKQGHEVIVLTSERGQEVFKHNPNVDRIMYQKTDSVPPDNLKHYWTKLEHDVKADKVINFSESIEVALALHPRDPRYMFPKEERRNLCDRNYYEYAFEWAKMDWKEKNTPVTVPINKRRASQLMSTGTCDELVRQFHPEMHFSDVEIGKAKSHIRRDYINIALCMSGSGKHKTWPWFEILIGELFNKYGKKIHIITLGDEICKLIEIHNDKGITNLAGEIPMREAMALTKFVDLVVSPDTGVLHASAMYDTPKVALLGHTTAENITKHFVNAYPVQADETKAECSPCFRLIYNMQLQCPTDPFTKGAYCMTKGITPEMVMKRVEEALYDRCKEKLSETATV